MNSARQHPSPAFGAALRGHRAIQANSASAVAALRDPDPEPRPFDLGVLMARLHNRLGPQARAKGLTLWIDGQANLLGPLLVDAGRLEQVLAILIDNAIQFTDQGEIRLQLQTLMISPARVRLRFEVRDTGSGLSPDFLTRLLTPNDWDILLAPRDDGTGQGLATSKRLIESMGGTLEAVSQPGRETTFGFELLLSRALTSASDPRSTALLMPVPSRAGPWPGCASWWWTIATSPAR